MTRRFSSRELSILRNDIPIDGLIEKHLLMPIERAGDRLRFACPQCSGFDTSIHREKNLARCFDCGMNFNTIEIVMCHAKIDFVGSVKRLKKYHAEIINREISFENRSRRGNLGSFSPIGEIIPKIFPRRSDPVPSGKKFSESKTSVSSRIDELENKFDKISLQLENLITLLQPK